MSDYTPITGKLRELLADMNWTEIIDHVQTNGGAVLDGDWLNHWHEHAEHVCDAIDAVHARLERENAALKAELDRVLGEQEEHAQARGESITDELREYISRHEAPCLGMSMAACIRGIADRIDAEHERQLEVLYRDMSDAEYVKLPKDADGKVWRVGDEIVDDGMVCEVVGIGPNRLYYYVDATDTVEWTQADSRRHHHAPTVEDVLREFYVLAVRGKEAHAEDVDEDVLAEYAKRLQLVGDAE